MSHKIWEKEDFFLIGGKRIDMDPVVVRCDEEPLPLVWNYDWSNPSLILGKCSDIRIENEEITCEIEWIDDNAKYETLLERKDCRLGGYYCDVEVDGERMEYEKIGEGSVVTSVILKAVSVAPFAGFPK